MEMGGMLMGALMQSCSTCNDKELASSAKFPIAPSRRVEAKRCDPPMRRRAMQCCSKDLQ